MAAPARSFAGTVGAAPVVVLPGSPRAVASGLRTLGPTIPRTRPAREIRIGRYRVSSRGN